MSVDISMKHTEDLVLDFLILDENNEPVIDLVGATAKLQIRGSVLDDSVLVEVDGVITAESGAVQFTVPDTTMMTLLSDGDMKRSLPYGTKITYADGIDEEPVAGRIKLYRGVVR